MQTAKKGNKGANGEFEYYGAGKLGGKPLNIVDSLPDGMSYVASFRKVYARAEHL